MNGTTAIVTHSEENLDTSEMGMIAAVDANAKGELGKANVKWFTHGFQADSPHPCSMAIGYTKWTTAPSWRRSMPPAARNCGRRSSAQGSRKAPRCWQTASCMWARKTGSFTSSRPSASGVEVLDEDWLGSEASPEPITGSPAVSGGRVFVTSLDATYAIGKTAPRALPAKPRKPEVDRNAPAGEPAYVQVLPYELLLKPWEKVPFKARLFDTHGRFVKESPATWAVDQVGGSVSADGTYTAPAAADAGYVKATVNGLTGTGRVRVIPPLPWSHDFDQGTAEAPPKHWINAANKFFVRELEGNKVLVASA